MISSTFSLWTITIVHCWLWFSFPRVHWTVKLLLPTEKEMVTARKPTSKSHSAVEEFRNARDTKFPWDHPFLYLLITPAAIPFGLCATLHCYYMINWLQLQLPKTVQRTFFFLSSPTLRNLIVLQAFFQVCAPSPLMSIHILSQLKDSVSILSNPCFETTLNLTLSEP